MKSSHSMPHTVDEAVDYLLAYLTLNNEIQITMMMSEEALSDLHFSLGAYIRNEFGLWSGNEALMKSCRILSGNLELHEDDASMVIIKALWERLKREDGLNIGRGGGRG